MPKIRKPKLCGKEIIELYNYSKTKEEVLQYFKKYRACAVKIDTLKNKYKCPLGNDNMGIFSSEISDPTGEAAIKIAECSEYIESMNKELKALRLKLTTDEKVIFNYAILSTYYTDDEIAEKLSIDKSSIYSRKKSCFIKVAMYLNIEVLN